MASAPLLAFHTFNVVSLLAVTNSLASADHAHWYTYSGPLVTGHDCGMETYRRNVSPQALHKLAITSIP